MIDRRVRLLDWAARTRLKARSLILALLDRLLLDRLILRSSKALEHLRMSACRRTKDRSRASPRVLRACRRLLEERRLATILDEARIPSSSSNSKDNRMTLPGTGK
jgi:hypothetical protein